MFCYDIDQIKTTLNYLSDSNITSVCDGASHVSTAQAVRATRTHVTRV